MSRDTDLRDQAEDELHLTTTGYANLKTKPPTDKNSHWYKALAFLDQIGETEPPPPPPPPPPPTGTVGVYGSAVAADNLGNIELKGSRKYEYRFKALITGRTASVRIFLIYRAAGYYAGNGGKVKVDLTSDSGQVLDTFTINNPMSENWPLVSLDADLLKDSFYRIAFTNPGSDPSNNWVSVDDLMLGDGSAGQQPCMAPQGLSAIDGGSVNPRHVPVFTLTYANGFQQGGPGYIDSPGSSDDGDGHVEIVITPKLTRAFTKLGLLVKGSGTVNASLNGVNGQGSAQSGKWFEMNLPVTLQAGQSRTLIYTGNFKAEALQKGSPKGFLDPFPDGHAVVSGRSDIDFPFYLA